MMMRWLIWAGLLVGSTQGQVYQLDPTQPSGGFVVASPAFGGVDGFIPSSASFSIDQYFKNQALDLNSAIKGKGLITAATFSGISAAATPTFAQRMNALKSKGLDPFTANLRKVQPGLIKELSSPADVVGSLAKGAQLSNMSGVFSAFVVRPDLEFEAAEGTIPAFTLSARNVLEGSRLRIDFNVSALLSPGEVLGPNETLWMDELPPGVKISPVSDPGVSAFNITFQTTQPTINLHFFRMLKTLDGVSAFPSPANYRNTYYPGITPKPGQVTVESTTITYAGAVSPLNKTQPLNVLWATTGRKALDAFKFPSFGDGYGYSVGGVFPMDPAQAAVMGGFSSLTWSGIRPPWIWQSYTGPAGLCQKNMEPYPLAFLPTLKGQKIRYSADGLTRVNSWGYGSTPPCYDIKAKNNIHMGHDISALPGTPVYNMIRGTYLGAIDKGNLGRFVAVSLGRVKQKDLDPQFVVVQYLHLDRCKVVDHPRGIIEPGTLLGYVAGKDAACGTTFDPHLHLETLLASPRNLGSVESIPTAKYIDALMFFNQVAQVNQALKPSAVGVGPDRAGSPPPTPPVGSVPTPVALRPAPIFRRWSLVGCTVDATRPLVNVALRGRKNRCTITLDVAQPNVPFTQVNFWYELRYTENGTRGSILYNMPKDRDVLMASSPDVHFDGKGRYTFTIPITVKQNNDREYTEIVAYGDVYFEGTKKKTIDVPIRLN